MFFFSHNSTVSRIHNARISSPETAIEDRSEDKKQKNTSAQPEEKPRFSKDEIFMTIFF